MFIGPKFYPQESLTGDSLSLLPTFFFLSATYDYPRISKLAECLKRQMNVVATVTHAEKYSRQRTMCIFLISIYLLPPKALSPSNERNPLVNTKEQGFANFYLFPMTHHQNFLIVSSYMLITHKHKLPTSPLSLSKIFPATSLLS